MKNLLDAEQTINSLIINAKLTGASQNTHMIANGGSMVQIALTVVNNIIQFELGCGIYGYATYSAQDATVRVANALEVA